MLKRKGVEDARRKAAEMIEKSGIKITPEERDKIEIADFGLSNLGAEGAQILTFFNTQRISAKVIALFPNQTLPEHWHPPVGGDPGKEESIRVVEGIVYLYLPGEDTLTLGSIPEGKENFYTVRNELVLKPGDQVTLDPGTKHWLQAGDEGTVVYSFSTRARDISDGFTDPNIQRETKIVDK